MRSEIELCPHAEKYHAVIGLRVPRFLAAAGMPLMLASASAEVKASKAPVHYRDYPNGMRMCHMCKFYISHGGSRSGMMGGCMMSGGGMMGAGACQVVLGSARWAGATCMLLHSPFKKLVGYT